MQDRHLRPAHGQPGKQGDNENYQWHRATMEVTKNGEMLGTLEPEKRFYKASQQGTQRSRHPRAA